MFLIAHAGHYALGVLEFAPLLAVAAFAVWSSRARRGARGRDDSAPPSHRHLGAKGSHP